MYTLSFATGIPGSHVTFLLNVDATKKGGHKEKFRKIENATPWHSIRFSFITMPRGT